MSTQLLSKETDAKYIREELQTSANLMRVANATLDFDQARRAFGLARRSFESAAAYLRSTVTDSAADEFPPQLLDLDIRLRALARDIESYANWIERPGY